MSSAGRVAVAIDARRIQDPVLTGAGRAILAVLPYLREEFDLVLLSDARRPPPPIDLPIVELGAPPGAPELVWLELGAARWLRRFEGVFHGTFHTLPLTSRGPQVLTLNDLSAQQHPEDFPRLRRAAWRLWTRRAVRRASTVLTISNFIRDEIISWFDVDRDRVQIARCSVGSGFSPDAASSALQVLEPLAVHGRYVCAVGGARRRGLPEAIAAFDAARQIDANLRMVVVGGGEPVRAPGVVHAGYLADDDWAAVLAGAEALVYATRYEGFGLPALEAMASGTPVVCAPVASLPEVLGDAGAWAKAPTGEHLGAALNELLTDEPRRRELRRRGLDRAAQWPSWADAAEVTANAYRRAWERR